MCKSVPSRVRLGIGDPGTYSDGGHDGIDHHPHASMSGAKAQTPVGRTQAPQPFRSPRTQFGRSGAGDERIGTKGQRPVLRRRNHPCVVSLGWNRTQLGTDLHIESDLIDG